MKINFKISNLSDFGTHDDPFHGDPFDEDPFYADLFHDDPFYDDPSDQKPKLGCYIISNNLLFRKITKKFKFLFQGLGWPELMNIVRQKCSEYVEHEQKELSKS